MKKLALLISVGAALTACGGGGSDASTPIVSIAAKSATNASTLGLTSVAGASTGEVGYDMAAAIGDTWRLFVKDSDRTFRLVSVDTAYGVTNFSGTYSVASDGALDFTNGTRSFKLYLDANTKSISGTITPATGVSSIVVGSAYAAPAALASNAKLDGNYLFAAATKTTTGGTATPMLGTLKITGTSVKACPGGFINSAATACDKPRSTSTASTTPLTLSLSYDTTNAVLRLKDGANANYGVVHIHAGDRGPVLLVDIGGTNAFGALIANKLTSLGGTEFNGNWRSALGTLAAVNGTTVTTTYSDSTSEVTTLQYNKTVIADVISSYDGLGTDTNGRLHVLPLSSAIAVTMYEGVVGTGANANMSIWFRK